MVLSQEQKQRKLRDLISDFGFASADDLLRAAVCDSVSPAICVKPDCDYTADMEPDQREGYCELCRDNTVQSALVLAEII